MAYYLVSFDDYRGSKHHNLGDFIYSLVLHEFMKKHGVVPYYVRRDELSVFRFEEDDILVLSGFFPTKNGNVIINDTCKQVRYVGFHYNLYERPLLTAPAGSRIGCRDFATYDKMKERFKDSYVSLCPSIMSGILGLESVEGPRDKVVFIDCDKDFMKSKSAEGESVSFTHWVSHMFRSQHLMMDAAMRRLKAYKSMAKKVYTTRLHAYLPCVALGIPVEYVGDIDGRTEVSRIVTPETIEGLSALVEANFEHEIFGAGGDVHEELHDKCMDLKSKML